MTSLVLVEVFSGWFTKFSILETVSSLNPCVVSKILTQVSSIFENIFLLISEGSPARLECAFK